MKGNSTNILLGIIFILFGIIFFFVPEGIFQTVVMIAGIIIILFGIIKMIMAISSNDSQRSYLITTSVLGIICGIILIVYRAATVKLISILIGISFFISGLSSLLFMLKSNVKGKILVKPIVKILIGLIAIMVPIVPIKMTGIVIGIILVVAGISILTTKKEDMVIYKVKVKK